MVNGDKMNEFMTGLGLITELWLAIYGSLTSRGVPHEEAIEHTKALISVYLGWANNTNKEKQT